MLVSLHCRRRSPNESAGGVLGGAVDSVTRVPQVLADELDGGRRNRGDRALLRQNHPLGTQPEHNFANGSSSVASVEHARDNLRESIANRGAPA
jgi:hypothetical protein